jgi:hypothetical protein
VTKQQRIEMLKARFKAKGGVPFVATGLRHKVEGPAKAKRVFDEWPQVEVNHNRTPDWMRVGPDQETTAFQPSRQVQKSALTVISEKYHSMGYRAETKRLDLYHA